MMSYEKVFQSFEEIFLELTKSKSKLDKTLRENLKPHKDECTKQVTYLNKPLFRIVLFGAPRVGKSRFLNLLLTNTKNGPLPTQHKIGSGVTKYPYKCTQTNSDKWKYKIGESEQEFDSAASIALLLVEHNRENQKEYSDNILIEIPQSLTNRFYLGSIEFIDCIGLPDESKQVNSEAIELMSRCFGKHDIDAIFLYDKTFFGEETFKFMSECGLFSFLNSQNQFTPKLVQIYHELEGCKCDDFNVNGKMVENAKRVLENGFKFRPHLNKDLKENFLDEMCSSLCLIGYNANNTFLNEDQLMKIIENVKQSKIQFIKSITVKKMKDIVDHINACTLAKIRNSRQDEPGYHIYKKISQYLYIQETYKKLKRKQKDSIDVVFDKFHTTLKECDLCEAFANLMQTDEANTELEQASPKKEFIKRALDSIVFKLQMEISTIFDKMYAEIKEKIKNLSEREKDTMRETKNDIKKILSFLEKPIPLSIFFKNLSLHLADYVNKLLNSNADTFNAIVYPQAAIDKIKNDLFIEIDRTSCLIITQMENDEKYYTKEILEKIEVFDSCLKEISYNQIKHYDTNEMRKPSNHIEVNRKKNQFVLPKSEHLKDKNVINIEMCCEKKWIHSNLSKSMREIITIPNQIDDYKQTSKIRVEAKPSKRRFIQIVKLREDFILEVTYDQEFVKDKLKILNENVIKYHNYRSIDKLSTFKNISLEPIFIYSKRTNHPKINLLADKLSETNANFLIFLFIDGGLPENRKEYRDEIDFFQKKIGHLKDSFIFVYLPKHSINDGCIRKTMMLLADHLSLNRFYILKDSIFQFNEFFKSEYGFKEYFSDCDTMARALAFMSIIMEHGIAGKDDNEKEYTPDKKDYLDFNKLIAKKGDPQDVFSGLWLDFKDGQNIFEFKNFFNANRESFKKSNKLNETDREKFCEIEEKIFGPYAKTLGQVSLIDKAKYTLDFNAKINITTHRIAKQDKHDVVLYNQQAIRNIHPVSDKKLYDCLNKPDKAKSDENDEYFYRQILNGVSGYIIDYFSYEDFERNYEDPLEVEKENPCKSMDDSSVQNKGEKRKSSGKSPQLSKLHGSQKFYSGLEYQKNLLALTSLFQLKKISHRSFSIGYEVETCGKFDDIIFRVRSPQGLEEFFLFQCKHTINYDSNLRFSSFSGTFWEHYKSFEEMHKQKQCIKANKCVTDRNIQFHFALVYNISLQNNDSILDYVIKSNKPKYFPLDDGINETKFYRLCPTKIICHLKSEKKDYELEYLNMFFEKFVLVTDLNLKYENLCEYVKKNSKVNLKMEKYSKEIIEKIKEKENHWMEMSEIKSIIEKNRDKT